MGTQVSKGLGAADRVASQQKANASQKKAASRTSAPPQKVDAPEKVRQDFIKIDKTAKEKARDIEVRSLERESAEAGFESNKRTQKESVLEAYGMASMAGQIQAQQAQQAELTAEKAARLEQKSAFDERRRVADAQKRQAEQVTRDSALARQQNIDTLAQQRMQDINGSGDVSKIAEILGVSSDGSRPGSS